MDRKGHWIAPATSARCPSVLFTIHVVHTDTPYPNDDTIHSLRFGGARLTCTKRYRDRWSSPEVAAVSSGAAMREWIHSRADRHKTNWCVAANASEALTLSGFWRWCESVGVGWSGAEKKGPLNIPSGESAKGVVFSRLVARNVPDIIRFTFGGATYQWVSGLQYLADGPGELGAAEDAASEYVRCGTTRSLLHRSWTDDEALHWSRAFRRLFSWWAKEARAPFGPTPGALAVGMLRTHCPPRTLSTHSDGEAHRMERSASFGGRASVWYVGSVGHGHGDVEQIVDKRGRKTPKSIYGPVYQVDVRSMYPHLLATERFPVRHQGWVAGRSPGYVAELCRSFGVIASCTIASDSGEYPMRVGDRVTYPVGTFTTTLAGPEIVAAHQEGALQQVHDGVVYKMGRPFEGAANRLLHLRYRSAGEGATTERAFAKLVANALGGKLAQRQGGWTRCPERDQRGRWGATNAVHAQTGLLTRYRHIAGLCWRWEDDKDGAGPFTFAFAYLTAYGRLRMRRLRELCPRQSVITQDTDGLWVTRDGLDALRAAPDAWGDSAGQLRITSEASDARWYGPRHYYHDGQWVLAGFSQHAMDADCRTVYDRVASSLWGCRAPFAPEEVTVTIRRSIIRLDLSGGRPDEDGWVWPLRADRIRGRAA